MFGGEIFVLKLVRLLLGLAEDLLAAAGEAGLGIAFDAGEAGEFPGAVLFHAGGIGADGLEERHGAAVRLIHQGEGEVFRLDFLMGPLFGQFLGRLEGFA